MLISIVWTVRYKLSTLRDDVETQSVSVKIISYILYKHTSLIKYLSHNGFHSTLQKETFEDVITITTIISTITTIVMHW